MNLIIGIICIYVFLETAVTGYIEYSHNDNKVEGILLYVLSAFCLVVPNFVV